MPTTNESARVLPDLSPVAGKPIIATFDGGRLTSDIGVLLLAEIDRRLENLPGPVALKRMMAAMVELFCDSFATVPRAGHRRH